MLPLAWISPASLLGLSAAVSAGAAGLSAAAAHRRRRRLRELAHRHGLTFAPDDRFGLARRVARILDLPASARPLAHDVIYGRRDNFHHYFFALDHSPVSGQRRRDVFALAELAAAPDSADPAHPAPGAGAGAELHPAPADLAFFDQYSILISRTLSP